MIAFAALALAGLQATSPASTGGAVMMCYVRAADLKVVDKADPDRLTPTGPSRLILFSVPPTSTGSVDLSRLKTYDPTNVLLGRPILEFKYRAEGIGVMTQGPTDDVLAIVIANPEPGKRYGKTFVIRTEKAKPLSYELVGGCTLYPFDDPDANFEEAKKQLEPSK